MHLLLQRGNLRLKLLNLFQQLLLICVLSRKRRRRPRCQHQQSDQ
jgi:hypothetical protein